MRNRGREGRGGGALMGDIFPAGKDYFCGLVGSSCDQVLVVVTARLRMVGWSGGAPVLFWFIGRFVSRVRFALGVVGLFGTRLYSASSSFWGV